MIKQLTQVSTNGLANIENLPERKQKAAIIAEVQQVQKELLSLLDTIDENAGRAREYAKRIKESNEAKMLSRLKKEIKIAEMQKADLIGQLRGIKRLARKINPELLEAINNVKLIECKQ